MVKGKQRAEDEGEVSNKRLRVELVVTEWRQGGGKDSQLGSWIVEALWALNTHLGAIESKLVASWEDTLESAWLLHHSLVYIRGQQWSC